MEAMLEKERKEALKADGFRRSLCLKYHGLLPWKVYIRWLEEDAVKACQSNRLRMQR